MPAQLKQAPEASTSSVFPLPQKSEKPQYVQNLFTRVSKYYDLMNDVMSLGLHRLWKKQAIRLLNLQPGDRVLDVCCGTGDLEQYLYRMIPGVQITGLDFCENMLEIARKRMDEQMIPAQLVQGDALSLPFEDNQFDGAIIGYGLRNVADYETCLREMRRVVKDGSRIVVLDMSHPTPLMNKISGFYRYTLMPLMGKLVANDPDAYRYLSNSIHYYLTQQELCKLMRTIGLHQVKFRNKLGGICAIHWGLK